MNFFQYLSKHSLKNGEYTREKPNAVLLSDNERLFQNVPDVFQLNGERFTKRFDDTLVDEIAQESVAVKRYPLLVYSSFPFRPVFIPLPYPSGIRTLENYLHSWSWFTQRPRNNTDYRNILSVPLQPSINSGYTPVSLHEPRKSTFLQKYWFLFRAKSLSTKSPRDKVS